VAAGQVCDEGRCQALDGIGASLAFPFATGEVAVDRCIVQSRERHFRDRQRLRLARRGHQRYRRDRLVRAARQAPQHRRGIGRIDRLTENFVVEDDFGIGTEYHCIRHRHHLQQTSPGLLARDAAHVVLGGFCGLPVLRYVQVEHAKRQPEAGQQFRTAGGFRGEMQHQCLSKMKPVKSTLHP
jgi:hypothetical protein